MPTYLVYKAPRQVLSHPLWMGPNLSALGVWLVDRLDLTYEYDEPLLVYRDDLGMVPLAAGQAILVANWANGQPNARLVKDLEVDDTVLFRRSDDTRYYCKLDKHFDMGHDTYALGFGLDCSFKQGYELVELRGDT